MVRYQLTQKLYQISPNFEHAHDELIALRLHFFVICYRIASSPLGYLVSEDLVVNGSVSIVSSMSQTVNLYESIQQLQAQLGVLQMTVATQQAQLAAQTQLLAIPPTIQIFVYGTGTYSTPTPKPCISRFIWLAVGEGVRALTIQEEATQAQEGAGDGARLEPFS